MPTFLQRVVSKLNPAQPLIAMSEGGSAESTQTSTISISNAYETIEVVNRCVNLLVDNAAMVNFDVNGEKYSFTGQRPGIKVKTLNTLLNQRPNPYMDISTFRRLLLLDFFLDGNCFIHFDGHAFYHIPAANIKVDTDDKTFVKSYTLTDHSHTYGANEIIHIKDNSIKSVYRGESRISSALNSLYTREFMNNYRDAYFKSGTSIGLVVETDDMLGTPMKQRLQKEWLRDFKPMKGNGKPLILDGGMKLKSVSNSNFKEMAYSEGIKALENNVCLALGIPPLLLDSGNNANLRPNLELLFYTTILPIINRFVSQFEFYFGFDVDASTHRVPALQPDRKAEAEWLSSLVNNGILTGNEAREELRLESIEEDTMSKIRIPANIAGSGTGVTGQEGGAPPSKEDK